NQLKTVNGASYTYDKADNMTATPTATQTFDVANEVTATSPGLNSATLAYDARGNRTSLQSATNQSLSYTYDQANRLTQVAPTSGGIQVAAGSSHGLAGKPDGTVSAWGSNANGQLGDG